MRCRLKVWLKSLNPFSQLIETQKELKELNQKKEKLDKELKTIEDKRKKVLLKQ